MATHDSFLHHMWPSVHPSVRKYQRGSQWTDFREISSWTLLWKSVYTTQIWLTLGAKISCTLHEGLRVFHIFGNDICSAKIDRTYVCASMATPSVFVTLLTTTRTRQKYKGKALLRFHCNNIYTKAPLCYVIVHGLTCFLSCSASKSHIHIS